MSSRDDVARTFDAWVEEGRADGLEEGHRDVVEQVLASLEVRPGEKVLDLGCGTGWATRRLAQAAPGVQAIGVDASPAMIRRADELHSFTIRARYDLGAFEALDFPDATFDRAFSMEALYYAEDLGRALAELHRVLRPGGVADVVLDYYAEAPATAGWGDAMGLALHRLGEDDWRARFEAAGFEGVTTRRVVDRRGPGDPDAFRPDECFPDWDAKRAAHEAGSLWVHAVKPA